MNNRNRPNRPRDEDREQLQADLTRLVGTGRLQFAEFDELMDIIWSAEDREVLDRIRARYLSYPGHAPQAQPPQSPHPPAHYSQPQPMAQQGPQANSPQPMGHPSRPTTSNLGTISRRGQWTVPEHSQYKLNGATLHLDLRQAHAAAPVVTFDISVTLGTVEVIVPPGVYVENRMKESWSSSDIESSAPAPGAPRVVLTGTARGSEISVRTRQLEQQGGLWRKLFGQ